jgi:hypothetical protein
LDEKIGWQQRGGARCHNLAAAVILKTAVGASGGGEEAFLALPQTEGAGPTRAPVDGALTIAARWWRASCFRNQSL